MSNNLKGGKSDKLSIADIAKKHKVSVEAIKKEIEIGMKVESEHTKSKGKEREIVMDHLVEDPAYYSDPSTGLIAKEKAAEKRIEKVNEETKKFKALAGIQESDKKFLTNESFFENERQLPKDQVNPDDWRGIDSMRMGISNIPSLDKEMDESTENSDFIVLEFDQEEVDSGHDDEELYKLK